MQKICFLNGKGKDRQKTVKEQYLANGLETRIHSNKKHLPHTVSSPETINDIVTLIYTKLYPGKYYSSVMQDFFSQAR